MASDELSGADKWRIYCNPGKHIYRCTAEMYGAPEAYIRELFEGKPESEWSKSFSELFKNFSRVREYCDYCEPRARELNGRS